MEEANLHVLIFGNKYYVGQASSDKKILMRDVVELTPVLKEGNIHHVPCFLGDLKPMNSNEWLISKLNHKSVLYTGYLDILAGLQNPTNDVPKISGGLNEINT